MGKKVKIGILGCADIAQKYAIKAFQSIDNAELISIASRDPAKAKAWAARFGIRAESSYDALLLNKDIDAIYIPLPVGLHKKWALRTAAAGKHIICEKSLAESFASAKAIVESCRIHGVVLYENFMCDFHPQHAKVLSLIEQGAIGIPAVFQSRYGFPLIDRKNIRYNKKLGGGILNDVGTYTLFMARKIFKEEPIAVTCHLLMGKKSGVDIQGGAMLEFSEGKTALSAFSYCSEYQNNYSIWGGTGLLRVERAYSIAPDMRPEVNLVQVKNYKELSKKVPIPAAHQFELIFQDFCKTILRKEKESRKINHIYAKIIAQAKALEALRISAKQQRRVKLREVK